MKLKIVFILVLSSLFNLPTILYAQELPEQYREKFSDSFPIRKQQHLDLGNYVDRLIAERIQKTLTFFKPDYSSVDCYLNSISKYRKEYFKTIGYPPPYEKVGSLEMKLVGEDRYCKVYRVW